ncbi:MAG TPA: DEAD/DEAH box helicase, partial [Pseudomonadales bacterium]|nr:DEAD/DEAH box helicase [Pseudomonadales bacterium]
MSFELFALHPLLHKALQKTGYQTAHPAQAALLPYYAQGRDLFITAAPGSGKTTACLIASLNHLLQNPTPDNNSPLLIVMT